MQTVTNEHTIMSFNLLCEESPPTKWGTLEERKNAVVTQIRETHADTIGVQECSRTWYDILCEEFGDEYGIVGELTNHEKLIWRNAVLYRKDKFELVETKTKWLSDTPDVMSRTPFYYQYRVMTYAKLKDKETNKILVHANTHMGFRDDERPIHWGALTGLAKEIEAPLLLTGDFNARRNNTYYNMFVGEGFSDAYDMTDNKDETNDGGLDHCFVTPDTVEILEHKVLTETVDGVDPSDHDAVVVRYRIR